MNNTTLTTWIFAGVIGVTVLLLLNLVPETQSVAKPRIESQANVRGMAVVHQGKPYTLNFKQQEFALDALNRSVKVKKSDYPAAKEAFPFEKITIYRFHEGDLDLTPYALSNNNIAFSAPQIDPDGLLLELSGGELKTLLNQTFDP